MIIVSGIPFSGTSIMLQKLKKGGLEIVPDLTATNAISGDNTKAAILPSLELKHLEGQHQIIFMEREPEECFACMKRKMKKEPHKSAFKTHLVDIKRYLKKKDVHYIDYKGLNINPKKELKKVESLIPNFKKATKTGWLW